jgi:vitamin B12 transporter
MRYLKAITIATSIVAAQNTNLGTIIVSATKSEQNIKDVTSNVVVITKEELEAKHITTVSEALQMAQGVIVTQSGGLGQQTSIFLRGFDSDSTLVLVDGVKVNNPTTIGGQAELAHLILSDIERIEIIKGAQSGIYGANAAAGVINIITKKPTKNTQISTKIEYGSYNTKLAQLSFAKNFGKLSMYLGGTYLDSNGFSAQANKNDDLDKLEDDGYNNKTFNAKITYDFTDSDKLELKYTKIDADVDYDLFSPNDSGYNLTQDDSIFYAAYTHKYSNDSYSKIYYSQSKFLKKDPKGWIKRFDGKNKEYGIDNKITFQNYNLLFGISKQESKDIENKNSLKSTGIYITGNLKIDNTTISATLRRDFYDEFKDKTTGKIGIKHSFENGLIVSSNYGTAYRVPSLFEYSLNSSLKPETIKSFDIGFEYKNFTFTYFYNKIDDEILYSNATWSYYNSDKKSKIKGFELGYKGAIGNDLLYSLNYTRFIAKDEDGYQLAKRPSYLINFDLDYYGLDKTHINLNAQYIGKRVEYTFGTHNISAKTGNVLVLNASADYKISDNVTAYVKLNNITNKKYQNVAGYATSERAVYVGINAKF